jgi:hypothetical protein
MQGQIHHMSRYLDQALVNFEYRLELYCMLTSPKLINNDQRVVCGGLNSILVESSLPNTMQTFIIVAVSSISAMNVDTPFNWLSPAPTRQRIESKTGRVASEQGTKQPT